MYSEGLVTYGNDVISLSTIMRSDMNNKVVQTDESTINYILQNVSSYSLQKDTSRGFLITYTVLLTCLAVRLDTTNIV